jgi:hypothetical protein
VAGGEPVRDLELPQRRPGERAVQPPIPKPILGLPVVDELTPELLQRVVATLRGWEWRKFHADEKP